MALKRADSSSHLLGPARRQRASERGRAKLVPVRCHMIKSFGQFLAARNCARQSELSASYSKLAAAASSGAATFPSIKLESAGSRRARLKLKWIPVRLRRGLWPIRRCAELAGRRRALERALLRTPVILAALFSFLLVASLALLFLLSLVHHQQQQRQHLPPDGSRNEPNQAIIWRLLTRAGMAQAKSTSDTAKAATSDGGGQLPTTRQLVQTHCGLYVGEPSGTSSLSFKGIAYASPPIGERRWKRPRPIWQDRALCQANTTQANVARPHCAQLSPIKRRFTGSEDCLYLDVYAPKFELKPTNNTKPKLLPVMVYVHGGFLSFGSSGQGQVNWLRGQPSGQLAAELQVVIVAPNYRLQALGFMALDELATSDGPDGGEGNYGLWDQLVALNWVRRNIEAFGGDPSNVCLFGPDSASAIALALLAGNPSSRASLPRADRQQLYAQLDAHDLFQSLWLTNPTLYFQQPAQATNKHYARLYASSLKHCQLDGGNKLQASSLINCLMNLTAEQVVRQYLSGEDPANRLDDQNSLPIHGIFADQFVAIDSELVPSSKQQQQSQMKLTSILLGSSAQAVEFWPCPRDLHHWLWQDFRRYVSASLNSFSLAAYKQASEVYKFPMESSDTATQQAATETTSSPKETYLTMVSDIRQICPINELAANLSGQGNEQVYRYIVESRPSSQLRGLAGKEAANKSETSNSSNDYSDEDSDGGQQNWSLGVSLPEFAFHTWDLVAFFGFDSYEKRELGRQASESDLRFQRQVRDMVHKFVHSHHLDAKLTVFGKTGRRESFPPTKNSYKEPECKLWREHFGGNSYAWLS